MLAYLNKFFQHSGTISRIPDYFCVFFLCPFPTASLLFFTDTSVFVFVLHICFCFQLCFIDPHFSIFYTSGEAFLISFSHFTILLITTLNSLTHFLKLQDKLSTTQCFNFYLYWKFQCYIFTFPNLLVPFSEEKTCYQKKSEISLKVYVRQNIFPKRCWFNKKFHYYLLKKNLMDWVFLWEISMKVSQIQNANIDNDVVV